MALVQTQFNNQTQFLPFQMESELSSLRRRYFETRQRARDLRTELKETRAKSRKLLVSCAIRLQQAEDHAKQART